jgi:hypothetical protein
MSDLFIVPGLRTPFAKAGAQYGISALQWLAPVAKATTDGAARGRDDDGVFDDLVLPAFGIERDVLPRRATGARILS